MNKEEPSFGEVEETSDETVDEKAEESAVSTLGGTRSLEYDPI